MSSYIQKSALKSNLFYYLLYNICKSNISSLLASRHESEVYKALHTIKTLPTFFESANNNKKKSEPDFDWNSIFIKGQARGEPSIEFSLNFRRSLFSFFFLVPGSLSLSIPDCYERFWSHSRGVYLIGILRLVPGIRSDKGRSTLLPHRIKSRVMGVYYYVYSDCAFQTFHTVNWESERYSDILCCDTCNIMFYSAIIVSLML